MTIENESPTTQSWQKLSKWSVIHFVARSLNHLLSMFLGLFAVNATLPDSAGQYVSFSGMALMLMLIITVFACFKYVYFSYQVLEDGIQVRQGVLFKKHLNLKFERIQNVSIRHPFYFRPLGLVTLKVDGAGSAGEEVYLAALALDTAKGIRHTIQVKKRKAGTSEISDGNESSHAEGDEAANESGDQEQVFYTRSFADLVIHGLTNNRAWIIVGVIFGFLQSTPFSTSRLIEQLQILVGSVIDNANIAYTVLLFALAVVLMIVVTAILSVLGSIVTYYGFTLFRSEKSLMVHRGLINKQEINMQKSRVQSIYFRQDWLDLVLGRANVIYEQITHSQHDIGIAENTKKILVPSARAHERSELAQEIFAIPDIGTLEFHGISKRYFYKYAAIWSLVYLLLGVLVLFSDLNQPVIIAVPWALHVAMIYMIWKRAGVVLVDDFVIVRKGVIGVDYIIFPAYKLQVVDRVQSLLMKRHDLSNIIFHTASRTAKVVYLPSKFVRELMDYCLFSIEARKKSWM